MQYQVKVQDQVFKTFNSENGYSLSEVYQEVQAAIQSGSLTVDGSQPLGLSVTRV